MTTLINVNVDENLKEEATNILKGLGLNMSTAINMFLTQVVKRNGIPFEITNPKPSKELQEALKELDYMEKHPQEYKTYSSVSALMEDLNSEDEISN